MVNLVRRLRRYVRLVLVSYRAYRKTFRTSRRYALRMALGAAAWDWTHPDWRKERAP